MCSVEICVCILVNCWGESDDLVGVVVFFVSVVSNYVNGYIFVVDGGFLVC